MRGNILSIGSQGGGIVVSRRCSASAQMITTAQGADQTHHHVRRRGGFAAAIVPHYSDLLAKCRESDVTVSVVGLGTEHDVDADILKDVAQTRRRPMLFQSTARTKFRDCLRRTRSRSRAAPSWTNRRRFNLLPVFHSLGALPSAPPNLGGYNLCYIRPEANLAAVTGDEYKAPVVSSWNAGNGRVLCFAGEADGKYQRAARGVESGGRILRDAGALDRGQTPTAAGRSIADGGSARRRVLHPTASRPGTQERIRFPHCRT